MSRELEPLLQDGVIDEILGRLKSGKEADIYLVAHGGQVVAAKVYKDASQRSFKNNADYKEGRKVRSSRTQRAIDTGSRFGRKSQEEAWRGTEAQALQTLHAAGVRVPQPVLFYEGILLMELVKNGGAAAPRLIEATYARHEARPLYLELRRQLILILSCGLVHGDLSPYNILAAESGPTVIDFPQVVSVSHNSRAEFFFQRDFRNLLDFVSSIDPALHAAHEGDGRSIWRAFLRHELTPDYVPPPSAPRPQQHFRPAPRPAPPPPRPVVVAPPRPDYEASPPSAAVAPRARPEPVPKYVVGPRWKPGMPETPRHDRPRRQEQPQRAQGQPQRQQGQPQRPHAPPQRPPGQPQRAHAHPPRQHQPRPPAAPTPPQAQQQPGQQQPGDPQRPPGQGRRRRRRR